MATVSSTIRNAQAEVYRLLDRLEFLAADGTTVLATVSFSLGVAAAGTTSVDPGSVTGAVTGDAASARLYDADGTAEITGLKVVDALGNDYNGVPQADAFVSLAQTGVTITSGAPLDLSVISLTVPSGFIG